MAKEDEQKKSPKSKSPVRDEEEIEDETEETETEEDVIEDIPKSPKPSKNSKERKNKTEPNKTESDEEIEQPEESNKIEELIDIIKNQMAVVGTPTRLNTIKDTLKKFKGSGFFNQKESKALYNLYARQKKAIQEELPNINKNVATLKKLFEEKQTLMAQMYSENTIDKKVAKTWNKSLDKTQKEVNELIKINIKLRKAYNI